jgi:hypothetical protein
MYRYVVRVRGRVRVRVSPVSFYQYVVLKPPK